MANVKNRSRQSKKKHRRRRWVLLAATGNRHKVREIARILGRRFRVFGLERLTEVPRIVERGRTFDANAAIKARCVRDLLRRSRNAPLVHFVAADDSGLQVATLGNEPGIRSARYAGPAADDRANRRKLLRAMQGKKNRSAVFHCTIAVSGIDGRIRFFRGQVRGRIVREERGRGGFGYDPVFVPAGYRRTFGELSASTKNRLSHRARALQKLKDWFAKQVRGC